MNTVYRESKNAIFKTLACGHTKKSQHLFQNGLCGYSTPNKRDFMPYAILCPGSFHSRAMEYNQLLLQTRISGKELLWKTDLLFLFPLPSVSPHGQVDFQHPLLGPRLSNTTDPEQGENTVPISTSTAGNSLLVWRLNCPDSFP